MLEIKNITKIYKTEGFEQKALDKVSVNFRKSEFASVLGPSGSGKTTLLNIIGGLDKYTNGDLVINGVSTKKYKDADWDSYRNHRIGFVFQSYNLISHQTILKNVELALTLSGVSKKERIKKAKAALKEVGLEKHINKRPNQLSGGQMQRVAIARALVNNPDIILADEPTGALDSQTSVQIMDILKKVSQNKLVIMVTHNPELANTYSNRIINLQDGHIVDDTNPFDGKDIEVEEKKVTKSNTKKTKMSFITALSLSLNNLLTKKGRTVLVSIAGSIGIIGIALILSVSTGFQNYVDSIQEETLTSYPLSIMKESFDITSLLMGIDTNQDDVEEIKMDNEKVLERQIMTKTLSSVKSNDIKAFKKYLTEHKKDYENDVSTISYMYSIDPNIYTYDSTNTLVKVNPNSLFTSIYSSNITSSVGNMGSVFQPMLNNQKVLDEQYDVLKGKWPEKYDELLLVLPNKDSIPDLITYSLGFRDNKELTEMVQSIFRGESSNVKHESLKLSYDDLLNKELKLILPSSLYKFNNKYDVYEDMSEDEQFMKDLYKKSLKLKIVGIVTTKEGVNAGSLENGIAYRQDLIDYIIDESSKTDIVKKQLKNRDVDVFSGNKFDNKKNTDAFTFQDLVSVDEKKLKEVFKINISEEDMKKDSEKYINNINAAITTDTNPALTKYTETLNTVLNNFVNYLDVEKYLSSNEVNSLVNSLEKEYYLPGDTYKTIYRGLLTSVLTAYNTAIEAVPEPMRESMKNQVYTQIVNTVKSQPEIGGVALQIAKTMTETKMRVVILQNVGDMTAGITSKLGSAFNVDPAKFASAFKLNFSEDELMRVVSAMNTQESTADTNLVQLGYQDKESPSIVAVYFSSFEGKENFVKFIKDYNNSVGEETKIKYSDITGALMSSVKTIVNAVSYVLIAFVSISLVVSSIMIGIITYISVYERTKEIGILRAIGASKRNVSSIFNAETFIIGFLSGLFGIGITYIMIPIINGILVGLTNNVNIKAMLNPTSALSLILLSIILTLIGGIIPAKAASRRDPVIALRTE